MLKLLLGAALFVCCGYVGYGVSTHYRKRSNLFISVIGYIDSLENGMSYLQSALGDLTQIYIADKKDDAAKILQKYLCLLEKGAFSKDECKNAVRTRLMTGYEQNVLAEMLFSLGKTDLDSQIAELKKYRALFAPISENAKQNYKKYGALAFKLGILAGLAALLVTA